MTQMSDQGFETAAAKLANYPTANRRWLLARALHGEHAVRSVVFAMMFSGCIFPPSLQVDMTDAALNAAPAITSVRDDNIEFPELKTIQVEQGPNAGTLTVTVYDTDLLDVLTVKIFVNYNQPEPTPPRSGCEAPAHTVVRTCFAEMNGVCQMADIGQVRVMQVYVFDRPLTDSGLPLYQHMEKEDGLSTSRTYFLRCQAAQT